jgi:hypothetical protein
MKHRMVFILICLLASMISCHKENQKRTVNCNQPPDFTPMNDFQNCSLCISDTCEKYETIWKELFMEKNNLSEGFFNAHIILCSRGIMQWQDNITFSICYNVKIDWVSVRKCDQFIVKIAKGNNLYPSVGLPRDELLSKDYVRTAISHRAFNSEMDTLSNEDVLKFSSMETAMDQLITDSKVDKLCACYIYINDLGHITLEASAEYKNEFNSCIFGEIDLINGNTKHSDGLCRID